MANFQVHGKLFSASDYFAFSHYEHFAFDDADGLAEFGEELLRLDSHPTFILRIH